MAGISNIKAYTGRILKTLDSKEKSLAKLVEEACSSEGALKAEEAAKALSKSSKSMFEATQRLQANSAIKATEKAAEKGVPKFLYHMTSEKNYKKILKTGQMYGSKLEQEAYDRAKQAGHSINAMPGKYMVSKDNFVKNWLGTRNPEVFGDIDIGESLLDYASQGKGKMVAIQIPTSSLDLSKLRFRPYTETCQDLERVRAIKGSSKLVCNGLPLSELPNYIDKGPVEFVYQGKVPADIISGATSSKTNLPIKEVVKNLFQ